MASATPEIPGFEDLRIIGRGGFATVYRARQTKFRRDVAIKILTVTDVSETTLARFEREYVAAGSLSDHPNIVTVFRSGTTEQGQPYIVMEYTNRGSLANAIKRDGPMSPTEVARTGQEILDAVGFAHQAGIIHRDIKPANILISRFGRPLLADFGISSMPGAFETQTGGAAKTLAYSAPEVINGERADEVSDLYSLAATLVALIMGQSPHSRTGEDSVEALINRIINAPPPDLTPYGVSPELQVVLHRGMAKKPGERYATAAQFQAALAATPEAHSVATPIAATSVPPEDVAADAPQVNAGQPANTNSQPVVTDDIDLASPTVLDPLPEFGISEETILKPAAPEGPPGPTAADAEPPILREHEPEHAAAPDPAASEHPGIDAETILKPVDSAQPTHVGLDSAVAKEKPEPPAAAIPDQPPVDYLSAETLLKNTTPEEPPGDTVGQSASDNRRRPWMWLIPAAAAVLLIAGGVTAVALSNGSGDNTQAAQPQNSITPTPTPTVSTTPVVQTPPPPVRLNRSVSLSGTTLTLTVAIKSKPACGQDTYILQRLSTTWTKVASRKLGRGKTTWPVTSYGTYRVQATRKAIAGGFCTAAKSKPVTVTKPAVKYTPPAAKYTPPAYTPPIHTAPQQHQKSKSQSNEHKPAHPYTGPNCSNC